MAAIMPHIPPQAVPEAHGKSSPASPWDSPPPAVGAGRTVPWVTEATVLALTLPQIVRLGELPSPVRAVEALITAQDKLHSVVAAFGGRCLGPLGCRPLVLFGGGASGVDRAVRCARALLVWLEADGSETHFGIATGSLGLSLDPHQQLHAIAGQPLLDAPRLRALGRTLEQAILIGADTAELCAASVRLRNYGLVRLGDTPRKSGVLAVLP